MRLPRDPLNDPPAELTQRYALARLGSDAASRMLADRVIPRWSLDADKPAPVDLALAVDTPVKPARPFRPWVRSRVPSIAGPAVLSGPGPQRSPRRPDQRPPGRTGRSHASLSGQLGPEILARCRPEVVVNGCEQAIRDYVRSFSCRHAVAQPGSMRYDLDGHLVEPVSENDRPDMQRACEVDQERARQRKAAAAADAETDGPTDDAASLGSQGI